MTMDRYGHEPPSQQREAAMQIEGHLGLRKAAKGA
jgi:hypothetical protein